MQIFKIHDSDDFIKLLDAYEHTLHEHDAPDPPLDWRVTPPETVIRWEQL